MFPQHEIIKIDENELLQTHLPRQRIFSLTVQLVGYLCLGLEITWSDRKRHSCSSTIQLSEFLEAKFSLLKGKQLKQTMVKNLWKYWKVFCHGQCVLLWNTSSRICPKETPQKDRATSDCWFHFQPIVHFSFAIHFQL